ncbi:MAG TPA: ammonium transporter [Verrucomicrobiae bacterium]|nr:ammonium transporter [Verrucomicrobiae bacterium]
MRAKLTAISVALALWLGMGWINATRAAATESPSAGPTLEQRVADLEAYVNNGARVSAVSKVAGPGPGHNAWMMTSAALVLFMTLPGLALFYGGLVRRKNVLSILGQCLGLAGGVSALWWVCGYSLTFAPGSPVLGSLRYAFLNGVSARPNTDYAQWVSQNVFAIYQMMFAIITPALIIGAVAERIRFSAIMFFSIAWMMLVYFPLAHMIWGVDGLMNGMGNPHARIKAIDFAGGMVVHMSSGWSALVLCLILGKRLGFGREIMAPHNMVLCMVGTGMLWVGWYGFNAGSAVAADVVSANAFVNTTLAAVMGLMAWGQLERILKGRPSVLGMCSGAVAGLATVTPASGFVTANSAVLIGLVAGTASYAACSKLKAKFGYDDSLDTFGVHAVGGTIGTFLTGLLATTEANPNLATNLGDVVGQSLWRHELLAMAITLVLSVGATAAIAFALKPWLELRPSREIEDQGLDINDHGEEGYILE